MGSTDHLYSYQVEMKFNFFILSLVVLFTIGEGNFLEIRKSIEF